MDPSWWLSFVWFLLRSAVQALTPPSWWLPRVSTTTTTSTSVLVIGGGVAGICVAAQLKQRLGARVHITIVERARDFGGVWLSNTYPGAACDIPSVLYSYSFEPNADWTRQWPDQPELLAYFQGVARKHGLYERARFNTAVVSCVWSEPTQLWTSTLRRVGAPADSCDDEVLVTNFVVSSVGQLSELQWPKIANLADIGCPLVHSAQWGDADVRGKRVAVVGAGASAIQIVPAIAQSAEHVVVFQSSPSWILPKDDFVVPPFVRTLFRLAPPLRLFYRLIVFSLGEWLFLAMAAGPRSRFHRWTMWALEKMRQPLVAGVDAALLAKALPKSEFGCRRTLFASNWYATLARSNVTLIDERAAEARRGALRTEKSKAWIDVDVVCCATGFSATEFLRTFEVRNATRGQTLHEYWATHGTSAYMALAVPRFPSLFMTYGPNSNLGTNSIILMIEAQTRQICLCIEHALANNYRSVQVTEAAHSRWQQETRSRMATLPYAGDCHSWYRTETGDVPTNLAISVTDYLHRTFDLHVEDWIWRTD
jgi:cation diffusion facilitator CzcD-associated flavoprotein CzcO